MSATFDPTNLWTWVLLVTQYVVPAGIAVLAAFLAASRAGANSDKALDRTIRADRESRILERRIDLYADILTHVGERRQWRDGALTRVRFDGVDYLDHYEPNDVFGLEGRARALADDRVLSAFEESNQAGWAIHHHYIAGKVIPNPDGAVEHHEKQEALRADANEKDETLRLAIRAALA
jgi:hypothetical protein